MYLVKRQNETDLYPSFLVKSYLEKAEQDKRYKLEKIGEYTQVSRGSNKLLVRYINIGD